jgi:hypothetical protein
MGLMQAIKASAARNKDAFFIVICTGSEYCHRAENTKISNFADF